MARSLETSGPRCMCVGDLNTINPGVEAPIAHPMSAPSGSRTCPNCGMAREEWQGNGGRGYGYQGVIYCCQGCAEGTGCTCA